VYLSIVYVVTPSVGFSLRSREFLLRTRLDGTAAVRLALHNLFVAEQNGTNAVVRSESDLK
jgi:hypothetical protein